MKYYRPICAMLALVMIACSGVGCANIEAPVETTAFLESTSAIPTTELPEDTAKYDKDGFLMDELSDTLDFGGKSVTVLAWDGQSYEEFDTDSQNGETINDALYNRNAMVEERLGVSLEFIKTKGGSSDVDAYVIQVTNDVMAGSGEFDMLAAYSRTIAMCAHSGLTEDLMKTPYIDLDKPWWPESLQSQSIINDKKPGTMAWA